MNELDLKISFYFRMYENKVDGLLDHLKGLPGVRDLKVLRCVKIKEKEEIRTIKMENQPIKKHDVPKIEMGKVYNYRKKDGTEQTCNKCGGLISWDDRPQRLYPMHVDDKGQIVGDGDCPMFPGGG